MSRKQNSSCDQCRKGKRACDAMSNLEMSARPDMASSPGNLYALSDAGPDGEPGRCSYCAKTNKTCTFDWVRAQNAQGRARRQSTNSVRPQTKTAVPSVRPDSSLFEFDIGDLPVTYEDGTSLPSMSPDLYFLGHPSPLGWPGADQPTESGPGANLMLGVETEVGDAEFHSGVLSSGIYQNRMGWFDLPGNSTHDVQSTASTFATSHQDLGMSSMGLTGLETESRRLEQLQRRRRRYQRISVAAPLREAQHKLNTSTNHSMISESLMQIYHDVLEGALSCWLTEQTCPYKMVPVGGEQCPLLEPVTQELGSSWSNRILRRVINLHPVMDSVPPTPRERQAGTRALQLAILAFSTQWAQGGEGHREPGMWPTPSFFLADFDRLIQKSFWHQARRALDECRDSDSFIVAYAEVIFGLTQKFSDDDDGLNQMHSAYNPEVDALGLVNEMLRKDMAYVYLERATRRLHVLKRLVDSRARRGHPAVNPEDGKTIGLIYWLAMMFDTISSAMAERPLSVSDEESWEIMLLDDSAATTAWDASPVSSQTGNAPLRWPCSEADVARLLVEAAPVKVLLFRKVAHIQRRVFGAASARVRDDAVCDDALRVLRHWNGSYGPLFQDLIDHHVSLPPRIQSWYVCLLGHWLLGVLLVADLMDLASSCRTCGMSPEQDMAAGQLRWTSVRTISALAKASMPQGDRTLHLFHSSVGKSALLTEPWTAVLIRTFSYAGAIILDTGQKESLGLCEPCVEALWHLGRKSDLSRQIASMLGERLRRARAQNGC